MAKKSFGTLPYVEYTSSSGGTGQVVYDATGAGSAVASGSNSVNITWTHTATGSNRMVIVSVLVGGVTASYSTFTRTCTYGGTSMTSLAAVDGGATPDGWVETFYLAAPATGAQTVSFTVSKAATSFGRVAGNSVSYTNASQGAITSGFAGNNTGTAAVQNAFSSSWGNVNMAGSMIVGVFGVDSSTTISSLITNSSLYISQATTPNQGTTRWTSNSGSTAGMTSVVIGDGPGVMFSSHNVYSAGASRFAAVVVQISPVGTTVPKGIKGCWLTMIGNGGAGGSGRQGATATVRYGGNGGSAGAFVWERYIPSDALSSTYSVYIPAIATGAAGQTSASLDGNWGTRTPDVMFGTGNMTVSVGSGHGGPGGTATAVPYFIGGGFTGDGLGWGGSAGFASSGSAAGSTPVNGFWGNGWSCSGGGGGGGLSAGNVAQNGGAGADNRELGLTGGSAGVVGGASPGAGSSATAGIAGGAAGGGAASVSGAPQAGANATAYGAGGGGGGASLNTHTSGAGGNGGPGYVRIMWDYR